MVSHKLDKYIKSKSKSKYRRRIKSSSNGLLYRDTGQQLTKNLNEHVSHD